MADCRSVCEHLHLPVQSGDDGVLRRMGRQYTIEHYLERLGRIRDAVPDIALSTDVIIGFPGETEAQFEATLRLLAQVCYETVFASRVLAAPRDPRATSPRRCSRLPKNAAASTLSSSSRRGSVLNAISAGRV